MFKIFISLANFLYRISGGRIGGKMNGGDVLLLSTRGRKTGTRYHDELIALYPQNGQGYLSKSHFLD